MSRKLLFLYAVFIFKVIIIAYGGQTKDIKKVFKFAIGIVEFLFISDVIIDFKIFN